MPKEPEPTGVTMSFWLEPEIAERIKDWAKKKDRSYSWIANKLFKQALVRPKWTWCGVEEDE